MKIYLAPLQGITDWVFRHAFTKHIGSFDKFFSPFIRVEKGNLVRPSQLKDILPQNNTYQNPIPQFLGNNVDSYILFDELCSNYSYNELNLNFGCPFPMVAKRKMGAGILEHPSVVDTLLNHIYKTSAKKISIKCRLGNNNPNEIKALIPIFNSYPIHELIIHPRIGKQMYKGNADNIFFAKIAPEINIPLVYNGDIVSVEDVLNIKTICPSISAIMIGRGILYDLGLLNKIKKLHYDLDAVKKYHIEFLDLCAKKYSGDASVLKRIIEMWQYHSIGYGDKKIEKAIKKCKNCGEYVSLITKYNL